MVAQSLSNLAPSFPLLSGHYCAGLYTQNHVFLTRPVNGQFKEFLKGNFDSEFSFILHMRKVWLKEI